MPPLSRAALYWTFGFVPPDSPDPPQLRHRPEVAGMRLRDDLSPAERIKARKIGRLGYKSAGAIRTVHWRPPEGEA